jgi:putative transposase
MPHPHSLRLLAARRPRRRGSIRRLGICVARISELRNQLYWVRVGRKWIADFTYVRTAEGWLYVAAVIDLFSRRVVGWSRKAEMSAQFVTDALPMAIWRRGRPGALSDRGSQYTSVQFQRLMADTTRRPPAGRRGPRPGNLWSNAASRSCQVAGLIAL